jgi:hypothetical protein
MSTLRVEKRRTAVSTRGGGSIVRARLAGLDPLPWLVGLVSLAVYALHGTNAPVSRDLGVYLYGGQRLLAGDPPYVGILNRAGPLAHALPGVGMWFGRLVGVGDIRAARLFFLCMAVTCVCLVYVLVRDLTRSRSAGLVAAAAFLCFQGFIALAGNGPREKTPMVLFLLVVLLALYKRRWTTAGAFIALGTLTWQPVFFVAALTAAVAVALAPGQRLAALVRIAVGGIATSAVVVLYYVANGALHTFLEGFVLINAQYTHQPSIFAEPAVLWPNVTHAYGPSLWVILLGLVALPAAAVGSARAAWRSHEAAPVTYVALGAGWLAGVAWSVKAFNGWADLFVLLPLSAIGIGALAAAVLSRFRPGVVVAVTTVSVLAATTYATGYSVMTRPEGLKVEQAAVDAVLSQASPSATILSIQAPEALVLGDRTNPTPYQIFDTGFTNYIDATWPGGFAGYLAHVDAIAPTYVAVQNHFRPDWLAPWLRPRYVEIGQHGRFGWWVSRSVPRPERLRLAQAYHAAMSEVSP